jgi:hypothetical protein
MEIQVLRRYVVSSCVAAAMLTGCGGSQNAPTGVVPLGAITQGRAHGASAPSGDLIYASVQDDRVYLFTYPTGAFVGDFSAPASEIEGMCTDTRGNVYVLGFNGNIAYIFKYAHGATKPTSTIGELYQYEPHSCAFDPTTGNLAVYIESLGDQDVLAIYPNGSGSPTLYTIPDTMSLPFYCTYDDSGDLFAVVYGYKNSDKFSIAELPAGGSTFAILSLNKELHLGPLQWVSSYLAAAYADKVYHLSVSGSSVRLIGITRAQAKQRPTWIQDSDVLVGAYGKHRKELALWNYPQGGKPITIIPQPNKQFTGLNSVLVSVAGSR